MTGLRTRPGRIAAVWFAVLALLGAAVSAPVAFADSGRPTIVFVHGAWSGPEAWDQTIARLKHGYRTSTPGLELQSISGDAAIVEAALDAIAGPKVLVGHSYGGMVISNASHGRTDIVALIYTAAFVPDAGDSILSLGTGFAPSAAVPNLVWTGAPFASLSFFNPSTFGAVFASDLDRVDAALLNAAQRPTSPAVLALPSGPVGWHAIPSWYAVSASDQVIDPAQQRWMATRAGASTIEFAGASHAGGFTTYAKDFARLIQQAVMVTRG